MTDPNTFDGEAPLEEIIDMHIEGWKLAERGQNAVEMLYGIQLSIDSLFRLQLKNYLKSHGGK